MTVAWLNNMTLVVLRVALLSVQVNSSVSSLVEQSIVLMLAFLESDFDTKSIRYSLFAIRYSLFSRADAAYSCLESNIG